jgi:hypothetical protein
MIVSNLRHTALTDRTEGEIAMSEKEWQEFAGMTFAPWKPRTISEFNAMCDLAAAKHMADDDPMGGVHAASVQVMKFGPNGEINFPITPDQEAYMTKYGTFPTAEQLAAFRDERDAGRESGPRLALVS